MKTPIPFLFATVALVSLAICQPSRAGQTVPVYDIQGALTESGNVSSGVLGLNLSFSKARPLTFFDIVQSLAAVPADENVPAVVLDFDATGFGLAQAQELVRHLKAIRAAGKDVYIYTENVNNGIALLGGAANHLTLMPEGNIGLTGLYSEAMYFKDLFDRVGVKVDVVHIGNYKSAGETFSRNAPSKAAQKQQAELLDSIYSDVVHGIAKGRGMEPDQVKALIDQGTITPEGAKEAGLVDELAYRTDFIKALREKYSEAKFDKGYKLPDLDGPDIDGLFDLVKLMFADKRGTRFKKDYVDVVPLEGGITAESIKSARTEILRAAGDDKCKALVLRVNSPGGSAAASDVLWEATEEFKATGKPFVVSMGGVAASGGYYISAGADQIFAEPGTVTGSIGVVGMKVAIGGALERLGIQTHGQKRGAFADGRSMSKPMSESQIEVVRESMLDVYATFKQRIQDGRGDRINGDLDKLAGGRVYSGTAAKMIGLVDRLGGLTDAIEYATDQAELENPDVYLLPMPKGSIDGLFGRSKQADPNGEFIGAAQTQNTAAFGIPAKLKISGVFDLLDPWQQRSVEQSLQMLEATKEGSVMLLGAPVSVRLD